jgi:hypothetical protein
MSMFVKGDKVRVKADSRNGIVLRVSPRLQSSVLIQPNGGGEPVAFRPDELTKIVTSFYPVAPAVKP